MLLCAGLGSACTGQDLGRPRALHRDRCALVLHARLAGAPMVSLQCSYLASRRLRASGSGWCVLLHYWIFRRLAPFEAQTPLRQPALHWPENPTTAFLGDRLGKTPAGARLNIFEIPSPTALQPTIIRLEPPPRARLLPSRGEHGPTHAPNSLGQR